MSYGKRRPLVVEELMTPGEVAKLFGVDPHTVGRWGDRGLLPCVRTPVGHRRFNAAAVRAFYEQRFGVAP